ncbi:hypothetical protein DYU11_11430 [Fibrisoma montanum]|uniref:Bacterial surface antigen (D15) domain-containing protein n=1 Tax=Fibrisoma montanum TaxID=2305895 RepID=A0A418MB32_9BACT|nr:BamA/TamA family outer membrane protein [Fibrisoma montanum]RIV23587.1 hypothetical protein DYU11_11430 [Fibrisoma montanum]
MTTLIQPGQVSFSALLFLLLFSSEKVLAQSRFGPWRWVQTMAGKIINDTASPAKPRFLVYPTLSYAPETSIEVGLSALYLYHAKNDYELNRLSEAQAFGFVTLMGQYGLNIDHNLYTDKDKWYFLGRARFQQFPLLYYGIGPGVAMREPATVEAGNIQIRERALHRIVPNLFGGIEIDFQRLSNVRFRQPDNLAYDIPIGGRGSANFGVGVGLVYDSRHNALNARKGAFGEIAYLRYHRALGSSLTFGTLNIDTRLYKTIGKTQVLAWQAVGMFQNGSVPFNQLALMGGEIIMRGYYAGRYRDKNYVATQLEYRLLPFPFSKRFGAAAFVAAGAVANRPRELQFKYVRPSGGVGLRYFLYPKKDVFLRFDVGFTREGTGFYIFTGESF